MSREQLQADLDARMLDYNTNRTHTVKFCIGKTPMQTFIESIHIAKEHYLRFGRLNRRWNIVDNFVENRSEERKGDKE